VAARERPYSVGEVARVVGISASTLRSWERQGLLDTARTASGHRRFSTADIARLRRIRDLRDADGLPVALIRRRLGEQARRREPGRTKPAVDTMAGGRAAGRGGVAIRLRGARTGRGLSLRALAAAAGVSASYVSALERGHAQPSIATLQKLARALGVTARALLAE